MVPLILWFSLSQIPPLPEPVDDLEAQKKEIHELAPTVYYVRSPGEVLRVEKKVNSLLEKTKIPKTSLAYLDLLIFKKYINQIKKMEKDDQELLFQKIDRFYNLFANLKGSNNPNSRGTDFDTFLEKYEKCLESLKEQFPEKMPVTYYLEAFKMGFVLYNSPDQIEISEIEPALRQAEDKLGACTIVLTYKFVYVQRLFLNGKHFDICKYFKEKFEKDIDDIPQKISLSITSRAMVAKSYLLTGNKLESQMVFQKIPTDLPEDLKRDWHFSRNYYSLASFFQQEKNLKLAIAHQELALASTCIYFDKTSSEAQMEAAALRDLLVKERDWKEIRDLEEKHELKPLPKDKSEGK